MSQRLAPGPADIQPVAHETLDRTVTGLMTVVPVIALGVAAWQSWEGLLQVTDLVVFAVLYVLTGLGITVGFHRLFTHRSFKTAARCAPSSRCSAPPRSRAP